MAEDRVRAGTFARRGETAAHSRQSARHRLTLAQVIFFLSKDGVSFLPSPSPFQERKIVLVEIRSSEISVCHLPDCLPMFCPATVDRPSYQRFWGSQGLRLPGLLKASRMGQ